MRVASSSVLGFAVVGFLAALAIRAIKASNEARNDRGGRRSPPPGPDDPRWGPSDGKVQIAGKSCGACDLRITLAFEGVACEICRAACHTRCLARHLALAHGPEDGTPYR